MKLRERLAQRWLAQETVDEIWQKGYKDAAADISAAEEATPEPVSDVVFDMTGEHVGVFPGSWYERDIDDAWT